MTANVEPTRKGRKRGRKSQDQEVCFNDTNNCSSGGKDKEMSLEESKMNGALDGERKNKTARDGDFVR